MHAHCLPGIDDGAGDWETCLDMLRASWESGVRTVIATPHFLPRHLRGAEPLSPERVRALCAQAEDRARRERGIRIRVLPGGELFYHEGLLEEMQAGRVPTLAGSCAALVEFSGRVSWSDLHGGLLQLLRGGYRPILAHLERYACLREGDRVERLLGEGILVQSNLQEMEGGPLDRTARWVRRQYLDGMIDMAASDMHNLGSRPPMRARQLAWLEKKLDPAYVAALLGGNIRSAIGAADSRNNA